MDRRPSGPAKFFVGTAFGDADFFVEARRACKPAVFVKPTV